MNKKNVFLLMFTILLIISSSCTQKLEIETTDTKVGIKPYSLSQESEKILRSLNLNGKTNILFFKAPKSTEYINVNVYLLGENGTWMEIDSLSFQAEDKHYNNEGSLEGIFSMVINDFETLELNINIGSSLRSLSLLKESFSADDVFYEGVYESSHIFLEEFKDITLNKEIPVAIIIKNRATDSTDTIHYDTESFFATTDFEETDYVQAVTLTFASKID